MRTWVKSLLRNASAIVCQSNNTVENVGKYYDSSLKTELIPHGIHRPQFTEKTRGELELSDDDILLSTVGRLVSRKGLYRLLTIISRITESRLRLLVIGNGPLEQELRAQASQLGISDKIVFCGFVDEERKYQLLKASDVYVSTSQHEGFGLVFLEAMSTGLPIVCYDHGGQEDFLIHNETGGFLPLNDESGFERSLTELINDQAKRKNIGTQNMQKAEGYYIDSCGSNYEVLFRSLLSE